MYVVLAWFSDQPVPACDRIASCDRFEFAVSKVVPPSYLRHQAGGADWGLTVLYSDDCGAYRWPVVAVEDRVTAVSLGLPVGIDATSGPVGLARRLLTGAEIHRDVVPPYGLIALDGDERLAIQQDWIGMCRMFISTAGGMTALCSRPSLLATFLHGAAEPDLEGWASYAVTGHFGGDLSPMRGVRLLKPGERLTGQRRYGGGWNLDMQLRYSVDDVVMSGVARQGRQVEKSLDQAAQAITNTAAGMSDLYGKAITLGLSGGKDSRLIAASLIAAERMPRFSTSDDTPAEGDVAAELMQILRDKRGLQPDHKLYKAGAPANVLKVGLRDRTVRLQRLYDFQFPSTYTVRPAVQERLPRTAVSAGFSGAAGELCTGYWYPKVEGRTPEEESLLHLTHAVPATVAAEESAAAERRRITGLLDHAKDIGVHGLHLIDYIYLVERVRRWYTSAYVIGRVTPFLSPGFVAATFGLTAEQKRDRLLHTSLIDRFVPEWSNVPFVSVATGRSTATRIWDGDGVHAIAELLDTVHGPITEVFHRQKVENALMPAARERQSAQRTLQQFTWLAVASEQLEPGGVRPATGATYALITALPTESKPPRPAVYAKPELNIRSWLRWLKRTRVGKAIRRRLP
jgi:asparagine synthase (glutamine-hydrolysing)